MITENDNILALYNYGSHVYGTNHAKSDVDMILVLEQSDPDVVDALSILGDVNVYLKPEFEALIKNHEVTALECVFIPPKHALKDMAWSFDLHLPTLRNAISQKASNSWVKCKKKFIVEADRDEYIGKKSAWHSLRILDFGYQIATQGKIEDYGSVNHLLPQIMECKDWSEIETKFKPLYNEMATRFRAVAPKEVPPIAVKNKF